MANRRVCLAALPPSILSRPTHPAALRLRLRRDPTALPGLRAAHAVAEGEDGRLTTWASPAVFPGSMRNVHLASGKFADTTR